MESRQGNSGSNTAIVALVALLVIALIAFGAYAILSNGSNREPTPQPGSTLPVLLPTYSGSVSTLPPPTAQVYP